jgi:hypothetical protein
MRAEVAIDARVHDPQFHSLEPGEHADCRSAVQKVRHHLRSYCARIGADAPIRDAVIGGEYDADRLHDPDVERALNGAQLRSQGFEPPQRPARLRQDIQPPVSRGAHGLIHRLYYTEVRQDRAVRA